MSSSTGARHAVVLGASMAGLLAARVLAEFHDTVTVLDRDVLPDDRSDRRGVPQGGYLHGMLARGRRILDDLYPGLSAELIALGANGIDLQRDCAWLLDGHRIPRQQSGLDALAVSRATLEWYVRRRTAALPNVTILDRQEVTGLMVNAGSNRVSGVRYLPVGTTVEQRLAANLVVDATGRGNRGPTWLIEAGYEPPQEDRIDPGIVYMARTYRRIPGELDFMGAFMGSSPERPFGGHCIAVDGDRWMVIMFGVGPGQAPPPDDEGYRRFAEKLPGSEILRVLTSAEPLHEPRRLRVPISVRRRYEQMPRLPEGFVAIGDALCALNPTYGQGMAVAAVEAEILRDCLRAGADRLPRRYFGRAAKAVAVPWDMSVGADLRFPHVEGRRTRTSTALNRYIGRLQVAAERDAAVARRFLGVANLVSPPQSLFAPGVLVGVLRAGKSRPAMPRVAEPVG
jgi:2-polyprenyl-6-methoxyphenol hydroxylase-like FAD-dependent oxidoreductase